jgi:hypothetical protein
MSVRSADVCGVLQRAIDRMRAKGGSDALSDSEQQLLLQLASLSREVLTEDVGTRRTSPVCRTPLVQRLQNRRFLTSVREQVELERFR